MPSEGGRPVAMGETTMRISSTIFTLGLAALIACLPLSASAQTKFDFPAQAFDGGNYDPQGKSGRESWTISLRRRAPGKVDFDLDNPRDVPASHGTLTSIDPKPGYKGMVGKYALSAKASVAGKQQKLLVMVTPSPKDALCEDTRRKKYSQAILVFIGDMEDGGRMLYGCGEFEEEQ
ncbi:hypothetical protein [Lysobacter antibioticus]|uniref:hypothetical protein n=1 Tax=Lysobacter antibioticus TaxID=84531 RepID=UPI00071742AC|nr:hypothetical protein [Lysobacter antibioticus]